MNRDVFIFMSGFSLHSVLVSLSLLHRTVPILLLAVLLPGALRADLVYFRNSKYSKGKVVSRTPSHIYFRTEDGLQVEIPVAMIRKIIYLDEKEEKRLARAARDESKERSALEERRRGERVAEEKVRLAFVRERERIARERKAAELAEVRRNVDTTIRKRVHGELARRNKAVKRSAILPGWGQHYLKRPTAGWTFNAAIALSTFYTWNAFRDLRRAENDYAQVGPPLLLAVLPGEDGLTPSPLGPLYSSIYLDTREATVESRLRRANLGLLLMLVAWGWNMYDVLSFAVPAQAEVSPALRGWSFSMNFSPDNPARGNVSGRRVSFQTGFRF